VSEFDAGFDVALVGLWSEQLVSNMRQTKKMVSPRGLLIDKLLCISYDLFGLSIKEQVLLNY
jgi:hypothetical protein